ncbi:glucosaminidase domain-containing protein [Helcococcus massiliensis]|uniref:glucosaminidase domain-containing protein n=1 Tax=Helcococcus massiliensis TaxID=2040290 RepID=UPI001F1C1D7B|nr:glycoside hydrolase family 73 protein [Helcococcus massiliensis]
MDFNKKVKLASAIALATSLTFVIAEDANAASTYKLNNNVKAYVNANDAKNQKNSKTSYTSGQYYIYKTYNGMINISKTPNKAGAWINPKENNTPVDKITEQVVVNPIDYNKLNEGDSYTLNNQVKVYRNANDAKNDKSSVASYKQGQYYVYKKYGQMLNITKTKGKAGAWINPEDNKAIIIEKTVEKPKNKEEDKKVNVEVKEGTNTKVAVDLSKLASENIISLNESQKVYINTSDASKKMNSRGEYLPGTYYVYKEYDGFYNISRAKGVPGAWLAKVESVETNNEKPSKPLSKQQAFINDIAGHAQKLAAENDLYASVMIAQAILESGYGTSRLGSAPNFNLFGVKGSYNGQSSLIYTREYRSDGSNYMTTAKFRKYPSYYESLCDYVDVLTANNNKSSWRYKFYLGARFSTTNSYKDATAHLTGRYATNPRYGASLNELIEMYNLTRFDMAK